MSLSNLQYSTLLGKMEYQNILLLTIMRIFITIIIIVRIKDNSFLVIFIHFF